MVSSVWERARRRAAAARVLTAIAACAGLLVLTAGAGVPRAWWPHTGQAFAVHAHPADQEPCTATAHPAENFCRGDAEGDAEAAGSAGQPGVSGAAWGLMTAGAGLAALVMWRRHSPAEARRR
jgi:hypothetical protein